MARDNGLILWFDDLTIDDVELVGGKNAALGEMVRELKPLGVQVPDGFAVTAYAYRQFLDEAGIADTINNLIADTDTNNVKDLKKKGEKIRHLILKAPMPDDLAAAITEHYARMQEMYEDLDLAVRSSATAEDLPDASFAGQQETYLNVRGDDELLESVKKCFASLFTNRAISYRADKGFTGKGIALSVGVQKMVRSDLASSGVAFSIDTETGFDEVVLINSSYGLGDYVVQGKVTPDEFIVFKPALEKGKHGVIATTLGAKKIKEVYGDERVKEQKVSRADQAQFSISRDEASCIARWVVQIEDHFSKKHNRYQPMDVEWAKDGKTGELFVVQARPETVHSTRERNVFKEWNRLEDGAELVSGIAVGTKIATGDVNVLESPERIDEFKEGQVLVTEMTDPDWEPIMKIASAIVTNKGGRTSHAAIVSRELGIPCIVGAEGASQALETGEHVTVDCSSGQRGVVYEEDLEFEVIEHRLGSIPDTDTTVMVNIGAPDEAFARHYLPVKGVGLGRLEFIINSYIGIHPNALLEYEKLQQEDTKDARKLVKEIDARTRGYENKVRYYVDELAEGMAKIGAAFYPHQVIVRFSDFKSNEYRALLGGDRYEPVEENPMLGWRGASRYYDDAFRAAFGMECDAMKIAREEMGVDNIVPMVPFCRTPEEGGKVLKAMADNGLVRDPANGFPVYMMCEIPSNVERAHEFLDMFDGMSIGSNDLTQLTLGMDRDSDKVSPVSDERDDAIKSLMARTIQACKERGKHIGICGQAPSDFPEITAFLVDQQINSISLSPDTVIKTLPLIAEKEAQRYQ